jgi:hypothetical protein
MHYSNPHHPCRKNVSPYPGSQQVYNSKQAANRHHNSATAPTQWQAESSTTAAFTAAKSTIKTLSNEPNTTTENISLLPLPLAASRGNKQGLFPCQHVTKR